MNLPIDISFYSFSSIVFFSILLSDTEIRQSAPISGPELFVCVNVEFVGLMFGDGEQRVRGRKGRGDILPFIWHRNGYNL